MSLLCRLCGVRIKFDDKHISERTGKRIPLDVETEEPHDCPARREQQQVQLPQQQRRYHMCNKGCGQEIYFVLMFEGRNFDLSLPLIVK